MASEEQPPDYFVSHTWGEPIVHMLACLRQHAKDRGLEDEEGFHEGEKVNPHPGYLGGRAPRYWICGYGMPQCTQNTLSETLRINTYSNDPHLPQQITNTR